MNQRLTRFPNQLRILFLPIMVLVMASIVFAMLAITQVQAQEVPTVPGVAISATTTTATVTVEATPGCDIEDVTLEYGQDASGPYTNLASGVCSDLTGNEYELTGLTANTEYYVRVSATLEGSVISTDVVTPFTTAPVAQADVVSITVSAITQTTATLTISSDNNNGGDWVAYRYKPTSSGSTAWVGDTLTYSASLTVNLTGLTAGTQYEVQAFNHNTGNTSRFLPQGDGWTTWPAQIRHGSFTTASSNTAPTASVSANPTTLNQGGTVTLTGIAADTDSGDTLTYAWTSSGGGTFSSTTALSPTWVAPTAASNTSITLTLTVNDGTVSVTATVIITVNPPSSVTSVTAQSVGPERLQIIANLTGINSTTAIHIRYRVASPQGAWTTVQPNAAANDTTAIHKVTSGLVIGAEYDIEASISSTFAPSVSTTYTYLGTTILMVDTNTEKMYTVTDISTGATDYKWTFTDATQTIRAMTEHKGWVYYVNNDDDHLHRSRTPLTRGSWTDLGEMPADADGTESLISIEGDLYNLVYTSGPTEKLQRIVNPSDPTLGIVEIGDLLFPARGATYKDGILYLVSSDSIKASPDFTAPGTGVITAVTGLNAGRGMTVFDGRILFNDEGLKDFYEVIPVNGAVTTTKLSGYGSYIIWAASMAAWSGNPAAIVSGVVVGSIAATSATATITATSPTAVGSMYRFRYRTSGSTGSWTDATSVSTTTTAAISLTGLTINQAYEYQASLDSVFPEDDRTEGTFTTSATATQLGKVSGVVLTTPADNGLKVTWSPVTTATSYRVQWATTSGGQSSSNEQVVNSGVAYDIPGLTTNVEYFVRVRAETTTVGYASGPYSDEVSKRVRIPTPTNVNVTATATTITVSWDAVAGATTYEVASATGPGGSIYHGNFAVTAPTVTKTLTGLITGTTYRIWVKAKIGSISSEFSAFIDVTPSAPAAPQAPTGLTLVGGSGLITASWTAPTNTGAAISGYDVEYREGTSANFTDWPFTGTGTSTTITGLNSGTIYQVRVRAINSGGAGDWSPTATVTQLERVTGVVITTPNDNGLTVTWDEVEHVTEYRVQWATSSGGQSNANEAEGITGHTHEIIGLTTNVEYFVHVRAETSAVGFTTGEYSAEVSQRTAIPAPANVITSVTATTITVSWDAVTGATAYEVWYLESGGAGGGTKADITGSPPATTHTITGLINGTTYSVWTAAKIGSTEGRFSTPMNVTPMPPATPKAPTGLTLTTGFESVGASWTAPLDTGNRTITGYQLEYRVKDASAWVVTAITTAATSHNITGLVAGTTYEVRVAAKTSAGVGSYSDIVEAKAEGQPDAPSVLGYRIDISRASSSLGDVELYWNVPADNGGGISSYDVRYRETGASTWTTVNVTDPRRAVGGLTLHQMYDMEARASNAHGASSYSEAQTFRYSPKKLHFLGASDGDGVDLYRWDVDHAEHVSAIGGVLGAASIADVSDMTVVDGRLYVIRSGVSTLYEIDLGTYAASEACDFTVVGQAWGLAELGGTVYLNAGSILHTIDVDTCATSVVGNHGRTDLREMASANGKLFAQVAGAGYVFVLEINLSTGGVTSLSIQNFGEGYTGLATNGNRLLFGAGSATGNLHYLSLVDLSARRVGRIGSADFDNLKAMAVLGIAPPDIPTSVAAAAAADSLTVTWVAPSFGGTGGVTGYVVEYRASSVQTWSDWPHTGVAVEAVITGLQPATSYDVRVAATNHSGTGEYSAALTKVTAAPVVECTVSDVQDFGQVDINSITTETISYSDRSCLGTVDAYPAKVFSFTVPTAVVGVVLDLEISRESGDSDPRLTLVTDPFGTATTLATNNDGGTGTNARITHTLATGTTYYVEAMDQAGSGVGVITLKITVPMIPEVHLRLWGVGLNDPWSPYSSADQRLYGGSIPGTSVFTRPGRFEVAVRLDLVVDQPFTLEVVGPGGSRPTALTFSALSTIGIGDYRFNRYRTTATASSTAYAGGTWEMALTGNSRFALEMAPDPTTEKWRASVNAAQSLAVVNVSGTAVISVSSGLRISTSGAWVPNCGATAQSVTLTSDDTVYVAPCQAGGQSITLDDADGDIGDTTYSFPVLGDPSYSPLLPASLAADTAWHSFRHGDPHTLKVRASHVDAAARLVVSLSNSSSTQCVSPVTSPNEVDVSMGTVFYLSSCAVGTARVELLDGAELLTQQDVELTAPASTANLSPSPADALFRRGETWKAFQNSLTTPVVVSTDGVHGARLALSLSNSGNPGCPATAGASVTVPGSAQVYVAGCTAGEVALYVHTTGGVLLETFALDIAATAFIVPDPSGVSIRADNVWHEFGHTGEDGLYAVVNAGASRRVLAVSTSDSGSGNCVLAINNRVEVPAGAKFYLAGCEAGQGTVQIQDGDGDALSEYAVTVLERKVASVSMRDPVWRWEQRGELHLPGEGMQLEMRNGLVGSYDDRDGYKYEARIIQTNRDGKLKIIADMRVRNGAQQSAPACTLGSNRDSLRQSATLSVGDTLHIRACTVDYSHGNIGPLDLADGVIGELQLTVYRVPRQGAATLVHFQALTVFANRMVLSTPIENWRVYHTKYDEDNGAAFSIPVQWAHPPGKAYSLPTRARFLTWVANRDGTTALVQAKSDSNIDCVKNSLFRVQNPTVLKMGRGGGAAYAIETCDADSYGVTDVSLYYWRGVEGNTQGQRTDYLHAGNLIARYTFTVSRIAPPITTPVAETSIGEQATPTPQPTLQTPGSVSRQYIGARPEIIAAESVPQGDTARIHNITIFWKALDDTDGYEVRIDGALQSTDAGGSDVTYTSSYMGKGFQLEEGKTFREIKFAVRGFKTGTPEGYTTQKNVFVPAHETYHSPWSREYKVLLSESGVGIDLGIGDVEKSVDDSVDLDAMGIEGADVIMGAQDNVKALFGDITGLEPDSSATAGLLPLTALFLAIMGAVAIIAPLKVSAMSVMAGGLVFVMIWGVAGPIYFAVPIAMAVMPCILVLIAGAAVVKTKGLT